MTYVRVRTRHDCCGSRARSNAITISGVSCGNMPSSVSSNTWYTVTCSTPLWGTNVRVTDNNNSWSNLGEVEVYGHTYNSVMMRIDVNGAYPATTTKLEMNNP